TGRDSWVCFDGGLYYLLSAKGTGETCTISNFGQRTCQTYTFPAVAGIEKLRGNDVGGVTKDDIVAGYVYSLLELYQSTLEDQIAKTPLDPSEHGGQTVTRMVQNLRILGKMVLLR